MGSQQPFLFLVDFKSSVLSGRIERLVAHGRVGSLAGTRTYAVERRCRRNNRRTAQTMKINSATPDIASRQIVPWIRKDKSRISRVETVKALERCRQRQQIFFR